MGIVYRTARSSYWQDRQRVLVCLSLALFSYAAMSSLGLWMQDYPEVLRYFMLCICVTAAATVTCIGLISVEKRLRSAIDLRNEMPERVATKRQCFFRIFYGMSILFTDDFLSGHCHLFTTKGSTTVHFSSILKKFTAARSVSGTVFVFTHCVFTLTSTI